MQKGEVAQTTAKVHSLLFSSAVAMVYVACYGIHDSTIFLNSSFELSLSRSAHRTPNFTNPEFFVCLLFVYFFPMKV